MIHEISELDVPGWLSNISEDSSLPNLDRILIDSLYYPASGLNGTPVKYLSGNIYSFIYADYGIKKDDFLNNLNGKGPDCGFMNYHSVCQQEVFRHEIVPDNWHPSIVPTTQRDRERLLQCERRCTPFGHWSVWQRDESANSDVGSLRFSFLFWQEKCPLSTKVFIVG